MSLGYFQDIVYVALRVDHVSNTRSHRDSRYHLLRTSCGFVFLLLKMVVERLLDE